MSAKWRHSLLVPATIVACTLLGGVYGPRVGAAAAVADSDITESIQNFTQVLSLIEQNYADPVDSSSAIFKGAVPEMLRALDPHSQFFDPESFKQLRDDQKGQYAGVGMQIGPDPARSSTVVIAPFPRTPAYRAGLRPRDVIAEVDGESTEGLNTNDVAKRLRGPAGTEVRIGVERRGVEGMLHFTVTRAEIPRKSVPVAFFLEPGVGFIQIDQFNETTGRELDEALKKLDAANLRGLIVDLRYNRGGLLSEGVYVSDKFLAKGQTIVSHYGRASAERVYKAQRGNRGVVYPMVVMVNCDSASASEIVAGALQDHDRALIVGSNTFGKGLVQTVYPLKETSGLALTTARYYTPSGRLIQRSYNNVSLTEYYSDPCSERFQPETDEVRLTDQGRRVFGGGGIAPDVHFEEQKSNEFQRTLRFRFAAFSNFAQEYSLEHPDLTEGWEPTDLVLEEFRQFLYREEIPFQEVDFIENVDFVKRFLKREVYIAAYDLEVGERVYYELDPDVQRALELIPEAKALLNGKKKLVAGVR